MMRRNKEEGARDEVMDTGAHGSQYRQTGWCRLLDSTQEYMHERPCQQLQRGPHRHLRECLCSIRDHHLSRTVIDHSGPPSSHNTIGIL